MLDAKCAEGFVERVGKVFDARFRERQFVGQTKSGRVEDKASESLAENRQQRPHHLGRARRRVQHRECRSAARAQIVHTACSDRRSVC